MKRALSASILALLALPALADAKPSVCTEKGLTEVLAANSEDAGAGFNQILCSDVNDDGKKDAVFTILSGGTAGPTRFGVASSGGTLFIEDGYKVTVDAVNSKRFDVQQPIYKSDDANCCPSSFAFSPYRWNGSEFKPGKGKKYSKPKQRFYEGLAAR